MLKGLNLLGKAHRNNNGESQLQITFFQWLHLCHPRVRLFAFAIPNGGLRDKRTALKMSREGATSGVPDIFIAIPNGVYSGLFIEFKYGKNRPTEKQKSFIERLKNIGYDVHICYDIESAQNAVQYYLRDMRMMGN